MPRVEQEGEFYSWQVALEAGILTKSDERTLQQLIDDGKANSLAGAARFLDWQEFFMDAPEHFYGP